MKTLLKHNNFFSAVFFSVTFVLLFSVSNTFAEVEKHNAGLLSDIWFSDLNIQRDEQVKIYGTFQNTSSKNIAGELSFWINDREIEIKEFNATEGQIVRLEADWLVEVGEFEIKIVVNSVEFDGQDMPASSLLNDEVLLKVKITRPINIEYFKEVASDGYHNSVNAINNLVQNVNTKLEDAKTREDDLGDGVEDSDTEGNVENDDLATSNIVGEEQEEDGTNNELANADSENNESTNEISGRVAGIQFSGENNNGKVVRDLRGRPFDTIKNFSISILQLILRYWPISSIALLAFIVALIFRKRILS